MARIRSIKPEFPQSESIGRLSRDARLLFVELWTIADDSGRARAASRMLASLLFPYDDDAPGLIDGWLHELEAEGCIIRYEVDGSTYLQVANWLKHQKIDKPSPSRLPQFDEPSRKVANPREPSAPDLGPRTKKEPPVGPPPAKRPQRRAAPRSQIVPDWQPDDVGLAYAAQRHINLASEVPAFRNHHTAKGSLMASWAAAWRTWCDNAVRFGHADAPGAPSAPTPSNPTGRPIMPVSGALF